MATARFGKGTGGTQLGVQLGRGNTATVGETNFTLIPLVKGTVAGPGGSADQKIITSHDTVGRIHQKASGMTDAGSLDIELWWDPDDVQHQTVLADWVAGDQRDYRMILPAPIVRKYGFRASTSQFKISTPVDDFMTATVSFTFFSINFNLP
jgi:hypothetical protein